MTALEQTGDKPLPHVHFIGIGGAGMGAIANVMLDRGYTISGSDVVSHELTSQLARRGAHVFTGHDASHIAGADLVVYTTAVTQDNAELAAARRLAIPVLHRSEMLAQLMQEGRGVAIAGAHGKTTTTSMVAFVLTEAGLDPTYVVGGIVANLGSGAKAGHGDLIIAEADESDGSFLNYRPTIAVVTNIEPDHLEHYDGDYENLKKAYHLFAGRVAAGGLLVACTDDDEVRRLVQQSTSRTLTYAIENHAADLQATQITTTDGGSTAEVFLHGELLGTLQLQVPGAHNVGNALAAIAVAMEVGVTFSAAAAALQDFRGALRRFQVHYDDGAIRIVDDYAHHPTEIRVTIQALKASGRRVIAVFQPQRYTRTYHLFDEFTWAFSDADAVILADIYSPAGEQPIAGVTSANLASKIRERSHADALYLPTHEAILAHLLQVVKPGDIVLTMGAGDIWKVARALADRFTNHTA